MQWLFIDKIVNPQSSQTTFFFEFHPPLSALPHPPLPLSPKKKKKNN